MSLDITTRSLTTKKKRKVVKRMLENNFCSIRPISNTDAILIITDDISRIILILNAFVIETLDEFEFFRKIGTEQFYVSLLDNHDHPYFLSTLRDEKYLSGMRIKFYQTQSRSLIIPFNVFKKDEDLANFISNINNKISQIEEIMGLSIEYEFVLLFKKIKETIRQITTEKIVCNDIIFFESLIKKIIKKMEKLKIPSNLIEEYLKCLCNFITEIEFFQINFQHKNYISDSPPKKITIFDFKCLFNN